MLAGVALVIGPGVPDAVPVVVLGTLLTVAGVTVTIRSVAICRRSVRAGRGRLGGLCGAWRRIRRRSRLVRFAAGSPVSENRGWTRSGFFQTDPAGDVALAWTLFLLALLAFVAGEELVARRSDRSTAANAVAPPQQRRLDSKATYWVPAHHGAGTGDADQRGIERASVPISVGAFKVKGRFNCSCSHFPLAITIAVTNRHWGSRWLVALNVVFSPP